MCEDLRRCGRVRKVADEDDEAACFRGRGGGRILGRGDCFGRFGSFRGKRSCSWYFERYKVLAGGHVVLAGFNRNARLPRDTVFRLRFLRRSEEHTSELQSRVDLVCRLLLEK